MRSSHGRRKATRSRNTSRSASGSRKTARTGSTSRPVVCFPHPLVPAGGLPARRNRTGGTADMVSSGDRGYLPITRSSTSKSLRPIFLWLWNRMKKGTTGRRRQHGSLPGDQEERQNPGHQHRRLSARIADPPRSIRKATSTASRSRARSSPTTTCRKILASGKDEPDRPCTFCNRCLVNAIANPLACYERRRFASHDDMVREAMTVFHPPPFPE